MQFLEQGDKRSRNRNREQNSIKSSEFNLFDRFAGLSIFEHCKKMILGL